MYTILDHFASLDEFAKGTWKESTYEIVSIVAYLIGVPKNIFMNEHEPPRIEVYDRLQGDKNARIIRNLCIIRTAIERNYRKINMKSSMEYKSILSMPEYISSEALTQLSLDGISFYKKTSTKLTHHIMEINRIISDRINNCRNLFPLWLNWLYIRELFIMPNGLKESGTKDVADVYFPNLSYYPYQMYINWSPRDVGNILYNDRKFVKLLYEWNSDFFADDSMVSDVGSIVKGNIYDYIDQSSKVVVVVDCENSDPYNLCSVLRNLDVAFTSKISRIILFDDIHTASAWRILENYTSIPVEHMLIDRLKQNKSLVDIRLTTRTCQEFYQNSVDSFIIVSSDSDYWGLISSLPDARFLVMIEHSKCSPDMKEALNSNNIFFCYIDDFYSANTEDMKRSALFREMYRYIDENFSFNVRDMLEDALRLTRITMSDSEKNQFYDQFIKNMQMEISPDGTVSLFFKFKR